MAFFKKKTCEKCGHVYDELADSCPCCNIDNESNIEFRHKHKITWLPPANQILLFIIGFLGFQVAAIVFTVIFGGVYKSDNVKGYALINACSYIFVFIILLCLIIKYYAQILKGFKNKRTYIAGVIGFAVIFLLDYLIAIIMSFVAPEAGTGGNQSVAIDIVKQYPAIGILILGIVGPICEELTYRVGLFSFFSRIKIWLAYVVAVVIFALIHLDFTNPNMIDELVALPSYVCGALMFALLYEREGFGASLIAHILNNMLSVILILAAKS